jgi:hypothetical protein
MTRMSRMGVHISQEIELGVEQLALRVQYIGTHRRDVAAPWAARTHLADTAPVPVPLPHDLTPQHLALPARRAGGLRDTRAPGMPLA